jgi:hypothetical protein
MVNLCGQVAERDKDSGHAREFSGKYLHAHPERILVYEDGRRLVRKREGEYDGNGSLTTLRRYYGEGAGEYGRTDMEWDGYGNLRRVTVRTGTKSNIWNTRTTRNTASFRKHD